MKRALSLFLFGMIMISMGAGFVSANEFTDAIDTVYETVYEVTNPLLVYLVGEGSGTTVFLAKVLFLIILFSVIFVALGKIDFFGDTPALLWVVSIAVSILSIRWLGSTEYINAILLPYSAIGIALTAGLPFVIYFMIVEDFGTKFRRQMAWSFFIVVFVGLWAARLDSGNVLSAGSFAYIYLGFAALALACLWFDRTIQGIFAKAKVDKIKILHGRRMAEELQEIMTKRQALYANSPDNYTSYYGKGKGAAGFEKDMKRLKDLMADLQS